MNLRLGGFRSFTRKNEKGGGSNRDSDCVVRVTLLYYFLTTDVSTNRTLSFLNGTEVPERKRGVIIYRSCNSSSDLELSGHMRSTTDLVVNHPRVT